jgi:signal peptidase I
MSVEKVPERRKSFLREALEIVFLALFIYVIIQYAVQTVHVIGNSMVHTLDDNDFIIISKLSYKLHEPQRGDIVVFLPPNEESRDFIKRIIAVPGDHFRIVGGRITVNGLQLEEPYLPEPWTANNTPFEGHEQVVPGRSYFVLGDNRNHSSDSRAFGYVKREHILGKAQIRVWPPSDIGLLNSRPILAKEPGR